jgi:DNA-binding response OmpR family regulator
MAVIFIVEDNPDHSGLYHRLFQEHQLCIFNDVPEALKYLRLSKPDLALIDFYLPSGSGLSVVQYIRSHERIRQVPIIGVSSDDSLKKSALQQGVDAFLIKPMDISELIWTARQLLKHLPAPEIARPPAPDRRERERTPPLDRPAAVATAAKAAAPAAGPTPAADQIPRSVLRNHLQRLLAKLQQIG